MICRARGAIYRLQMSRQLLNPPTGMGEAQVNSPHNSMIIFISWALVVKAKAWKGEYWGPERRRDNP